MMGKKFDAEPKTIYQIIIKLLIDDPIRYLKKSMARNFPSLILMDARCWWHWWHVKCVYGENPTSYSIVVYKVRNTLLHWSFRSYFSVNRNRKGMQRKHVLQSKFLRQQSMGICVYECICVSVICVVAIALLAVQKLVHRFWQHAQYCKFYPSFYISVMFLILYAMCSPLPYPPIYTYDARWAWIAV
jgi:hypothetical protein